MKTAIWFALIGWWAGTAWLAIAVAFCATIFLLPIGWPMLKAVPQVFFGPD